MGLGRRSRNINQMKTDSLIIISMKVLTMMTCMISMNLMICIKVRRIALMLHNVLCTIYDENNASGLK